MSDAFLIWILNRGVEVGVVILLLFFLRGILIRVFPRSLCYWLWSCVPLYLTYKCLELAISRRGYDSVRYGKGILSVGIGPGEIWLLKIVFVIGLIGIVLYRVVSYLRLSRYLVGSIKFRDNIYISEKIVLPFSMGMFFPRIYLPSVLKTQCYSPVIEHEQVHISRKDIWFNIIWLAILSLLWFQPLLWFGYRLFTKDMEIACDEEVLRKSGQDFREDYAKSLLELSCKDGNPEGMTVRYTGGEVKERIKCAMNYRKPGFRAYVGAFVLSVVVIFAAIPLARQLFVTFVVKEESTLTGRNREWEVTVEEHVTKKNTK